jgi:hypothetical protein
MNFKKLYALALALLTVTLILHFIGYFTYVVGGWAFLIILPIFVIFGTFIVSSWSDPSLVKRDQPTFLNSYTWRPGAVRKFFKHVNKPLFILAIALIVYVGIQFFALTLVMLNGEGVMVKGLYYLTDHGEIIRQIDFATYENLRFADYRLLTGHPMIFAIIPAVYFSYRMKLQHDLSSSPTTYSQSTTMSRPS